MPGKLSSCLNLLHPEPTLSVTLQGFMLACFEGTKKFKVGIPACPDHDLRIDIFRLPRKAPEMDPSEWQVVKSIPSSVRKISILEGGPDGKTPGPGVTSYKYFEGQFSRFRKRLSKKQRRDFRWMVDLNGEEFHNRPLTLLETADRTGQAKIISPVIEFNTGTVYTQAVSSEILFRRDEDGRVKPLGRIAYRTGIDIGSPKLTIGYTTSDGAEEMPLVIERDADSFYHLVITNTCHIRHSSQKPEETAGKTDFNLFYDLMRDPVIPHRQYDLQSCIDSSIRSDSRLDGFPDICILGYFGGESYNW